MVTFLRGVSISLLIVSVLLMASFYTVPSLIVFAVSMAIAYPVRKKP